MHKRRACPLHASILLLVIVSFGLVSACNSGSHPSSKIYVTQPNSVETFPLSANGNVAPTTTITGANTELSSPFGIAIDSHNSIYVIDNATNRVTVYAAGSSGNVAPTATISGVLTLLDGPVGIALDTAGKIYVTNLTGDYVTVYAAGASGNANPIATISGANTGFAILRGIAVH